MAGKGEIAAGKIEKIALVKPCPLGDLFFALPALDALRTAYPEAEIVYLGRAWQSEFLPGRLPSIDRALTIPQYEGLLFEKGKSINVEEQRAFFEAMGRERFDLAIQLYGGGHFSNPFIKKLGACLTIGAKAENAEPLDRWTPYVYYQNEVARNLDIVRLAGAGPCSLEPSLPVLPADLRASGPALATISKPFVVIHPGSTDPRRCWLTERYAEVADYCANRGLTVVLTGVTAESAQVKAVQERMRVPALNYCGKLGLEALVGVLSRARLIVTNNTGPLHLALAIGTPSIGLFWAEQVINTLPLSRRIFHPLIAWKRECPQCGLYCDKAEFDNPNPSPCRHQNSFLGEIDAGQVIAAVEHMLVLTADFDKWKDAPAPVAPRKSLD